MLKKKILKHLAALVIGGALSGAAGAQIDPDHIGQSFKELGKLAAAGAAASIWTLNIRAPKDE